MILRIRFLCASLVLGGMLMMPPAAQEAQAQPFTFTIVETDLTALDYGALAYADLNGDGVLDLIASGNSNRQEPFRPTAYVAFSVGETFQSGSWRRTFDETRLSTELWHSAVTWLDYDLDGDLDFVLAGTARSGAAFENLPFEGVTRLYRNNGSGVFAEVDAGFVGVYSSAVARGDYDNDGDDDVLLTGLTDPDSPVTRLYRNDGGTFVPEDGPFRQLAFGDAQWADYDNDGDLDLALSGAEIEGGFFTLLYRNDGAAGFTEVNAGLPGLAFSNFDFGDYDNDGDLDLALTGGELSLPGFFDTFAAVYRNDQGRFNRINAPLKGILYGNTAWGDYDNDGRRDLLIVGADDITSGRSGRVYRNEGGNDFTARVGLIGLAASSVTWGDYDADNDLDVIAAGTNLSFNPLIRLYRNDRIVSNMPPSAPSGLQAGVQGNAVTLSWSPATDDETPAAGLTYALRVGTAPGETNIVAPMAEPVSGRRWIPGRGNVEHNTQWTLRGLPLGTYFWSVQAIDAGFLGSEFTEEGSFTISTNADVDTGTEDDGGLPTEYALHPSYPNPFREAATIAYDLPEPTAVALTVYNILGAEVNHLVNQVQAAGRRQVVWNGRDDAGRRVGAGVYFVRMQAGPSSWTRQLVRVN